MENNSVTSGKFTCPKDFKEVINTEGLCLEDIDEDSELYIIQAPADADLKKLHDQQLLFNGPTTFYYPSEDSPEQIYKCTTTDVDRQFTRGCLVLPERSSLKLCAAEKHIEGVIYVEKCTPFPEIGFPKEIYSKIRGLENLKKEKPLSSGNSTVLSDDRDKQRTPKDSTKDLTRADECSSQSGKKKKKHNKHLIQDAGLSEDIPVKSKKKHNNSKGDQVIHIQAEALSDGGNSGEDAALRGAEHQGKSNRNVEPEDGDYQMQHSDIINSKHVASIKKKRKRLDEVSQNVDEAESHEHSPLKPHKKKARTLNSSFTDSHLIKDSEESKKHGKTKHKSDKLKKPSSEENHHGQSNCAYVSSFKIKEEGNVTEENTSCTSSSGETSGELLGKEKSEKKKKKRKEKASFEGDKTTDSHLIGDSQESKKCKIKHKTDKLKKVSSDTNHHERSNNSFASSFKIKEEVESNVTEENSSHVSCPDGIGYGELPSDKKKSKPKKKKDVSYEDKTTNSSFADPHVAGDSQESKKHSKTKHKSDKLKKLSSEENHHGQSNSAYVSNFKIKEEVAGNVMEENTSCSTGETSGELVFGEEKSKKKKKKKRKAEVSCEDD